MNPPRDMHRWRAARLNRLLADNEEMARAYLTDVVVRHYAMCYVHGDIPFVTFLAKLVGELSKKNAEITSRLAGLLAMFPERTYYRTIT